MLYDFEFYTNRPSYYSRPRYYPSYYTPSYYDKYYRYYPSYYRTPSTYYSSYRPYRYNYDYRYDIPDYRYRYYTTIPPRVTSLYPESEKYAHTYGLNFNTTAKEIRDSTTNLLREVRQSVARASSLPRFIRASSLEPTYNRDDDFYDTLARNRRAVSRARLLSEEPYFSSFYWTTSKSTSW